MFGYRRQREQLAALRAEVVSLQGRLASDLNTLADNGDPLSRQALADAAERNSAAGALLSSAGTVGELEVAKRIVAEGLTATRIVREKQGLPLGPELPDRPAATVNTPTPVSFDKQSYTAYPAYHPDTPHFFGGSSGPGSAIPAGYYKTPFWKKALAIGGAVVGGEMIGSAVGDLIQDGGGGFDSNYGSDDGGDWGGGGSDFDGGGGGDW